MSTIITIFYSEHIYTAMSSKRAIYGMTGNTLIKATGKKKELQVRRDCRSSKERNYYLSTLS